MDIPAAVYIIWIIVLVIAYASVPLLLSVLTRILNAARKIERYAAATRAASAGIRSHVANGSELAETSNLLMAARGVGDELAAEGAAISEHLVSRAGERR